MTNTRANPYPGPRSFQKDEKLYGRQRETWELLNLLIGERIVLLSSPSGAGKTSLVQAALLPELQNEGFRVLPVMRPGLLPDGPAPGANRYVLSLLLGLEAGRPETEQLPLAELGGMSLGAYLQKAWPAPKGSDWHGDVLIFDQFEEVLTVDPSDRAVKQAFFDQVGAALRDRSRWALFSMREEFVAALDPYLRPIPARFDKGRRYRLDLLGPEAARQAMQGPAADQVAARRVRRCGRPPTGRRPAAGAGAAARRQDRNDAGPLYRTRSTASGLPAAVGQSRVRGSQHRRGRPRSGGRC